jgi:hypothetical protein
VWAIDNKAEVNANEERNTALGRLCVHRSGARVSRFGWCDFSGIECDWRMRHGSIEADAVWVFYREAYAARAAVALLHAFANPRLQTLEV